MSTRPRARRPGPYAVGRRSLVGLLACLLWGALALSGCGQPSSSVPDGGVAPTVSVPVQPTLTPEATTPDTVDPSAPGPGGVFDAADSLVSQRCVATGGVWDFTAELKNTDTTEHVFTVGVFILSATAPEPLAQKEIDVRLAPGASAPVEAKALYTSTATGLECLTGVTVKGQ